MYRCRRRLWLLRRHLLTLLALLTRLTLVNE